MPRSATSSLQPRPKVPLTKPMLALSLGLALSLTAGCSDDYARDRYFGSETGRFYEVIPPTDAGTDVATEARATDAEGDAVPAVVEPQDGATDGIRDAGAETVVEADTAPDVSDAANLDSGLADTSDAPAID